MEFRISVAELSKTLSMMQGVIQKRNTLDILSNVLIEIVKSSKHQIFFSTTDLDIGLNIKRNCDIIKTGKITVSVKSLLDIVKVLPGPDVNLKLMNNDQFKIESGRTKALLNSISASSYPKVNSFEEVTFNDLNAKLFTSMINKTLYSVSIDESRNNLRGVYFEPTLKIKGSLSLISTDGHRLSKIERIFNKSCFEKFKPVILPRKGLVELLRLLDNEQIPENNVFKLGFTNTKAIAKVGNAILSMKLIDGKFPDYNQVIPKLSDKIVKTSRINFLTSLRRVSVLSADKSQSLKLSCINSELSLSCFNPEVGKVSDYVQVEYNGPNIEINFNARYIIDALSSLSDHNIMLKFTDSLSPILICGISDESHICVVMPMRI